MVCSNPLQSGQFTRYIRSKPPKYKACFSEFVNIINPQRVLEKIWKNQLFKMRHQSSSTLAKNTCCTIKYSYTYNYRYSSFGMFRRSFGNPFITCKTKPLEMVIFSYTSNSKYLATFYLLSNVSFFPSIVKYYCYL